MNKKTILLLLTVLLFGITSCLSTFNDNIRSKFSSGGLSIKKIQFYNSGKIKLKRILKNEEVKTTMGTVQFENGKYYEVIIIFPKTPCVIDSTDDTRGIINVRFEDGADKTIPFIFTNDHYVMNFATTTTYGYAGKLFYNGQEYLIEDGKNVRLLLNLSDRVIEKYDSRILRGIRIRR